MKHRLLITMSGGTTNVINATLAGIVRQAREESGVERVFAGVPGILGVLQEDLVDLTRLTSPQLDRLRRTPASGFTGTTRVRPLSAPELARFEEVCRAHGITAFCNIGGNGTIRQTVQIARTLPGLQTAALPKTVDNDLGDDAFRDVLYTPGFPSCAHYWRHKVLVMNQENSGAASHDRVLITQTFGRETGFLAGTARLADRKRRLPLILLLPEDPQPLARVMAHIAATVKRDGRAMVVAAEGYPVDAFDRRQDPTGQTMYSSSSTTVTQQLVNACFDSGIPARGFVPGIDQRSEMSFVSGRDLRRAEDVGVFAVRRLLRGENGFFASVSAGDRPGRVRYRGIPLAETGDFSRRLPLRWLRRGGFDVADAYLDYVEPLIGQEFPGPLVRNGVPVFSEPCRTFVQRRCPAWKEGAGV